MNVEHSPNADILIFVLRDTQPLNATRIADVCPVRWHLCLYIW